MINQKKITVLTNKLELKHQCLDLCDFSDAYIVEKGKLLLLMQIMQKEIKQ